MKIKTNENNFENLKVEFKFTDVPNIPLILI